MSTVVPIKTSFAAGEISPRLRGRVGSDIYGAGLSRCRNWIPTAQGSIRCRAGAQFVHQIRDFSAPEIGDPVDITSVSKIVAVPLPGREGYLVAFGDSYVDVMSADALVEYAGTARADLDMDVDIFDGDDWDFDAQENWSATGSPAFGMATWVTGTPATCVQFHAGESIFQSFDVTHSGTYLFRFTFPEFEPNGLAGTHWPGYDTPGTMRVQLGTGDGDGTYYELELTGDSGLGRNVSFCVPVDLPAGEHGITVTLDAISGAAALTGLSLQLFSRTNFVTPWDSSIINELWTTPYVSEGSFGLVVCHETTAPALVMIDQYGDWSYSAITFTNAPAEWGPGNYPRVALMFQDRLWLGSTPAQPDAFWASKTGSYFDFDLGTGEFTDGLDYRLGVTQEIRWLAAYQQALIIGTDLGEHVITAAGGAIATADIHARFESSYGSARKPPLIVNGRLFYSSRDRRKLRALSFEQAAEAWSSNDVTFAAEHVTLQQVKEFAFARDPDNQLVAVLDNGTLACATLGPNSAGWWTADGFSSVRSVAVTEGDVSRVWLLDSDYNLHQLLFDDGASDRFLDRWCERTVEAGGTLRVEHLRSTSVIIITEDGTTVTKTTDADGDATGLADYEGDLCLVGKTISFYAKLLPPEAGGERGTAQRMRRHWPSVTVRVYDSGLPTINTVRAKGSLTDPESRVSEDAVVHLLGHGDGALIIEQSLPVRTEVLALFGVLNSAEV